jgi:hypothetical protein
MLGDIDGDVLCEAIATTAAVAGGVAMLGVTAGGATDGDGSTATTAAPWDCRASQPPAATAIRKAPSSPSAIARRRLLFT